MPYKTLDELPEAVKGIPQHAQEIWMAAFNSAWDQYNGDEGKCAATAWAGVEKKYRKEGDQWVAIETASLTPRYILKEIPKEAKEFQVLPFGKIDIEGEPPAFITESGAEKIIAAFERRGNDMVIDYEHQTLSDREAPAAGWVKKIANKGKDGLWAIVDWTEKAWQYIQAKEYRYFSPVFWISQNREVVKIEMIALTNYPKINNLRPIIAKMSLEEGRNEQESRSKKYGIAIKEGGHITKPGEWSSVPDDEFLDPVNYRYPCPDADQTSAAATYWGKPDNQAQYSSEEKAIIDKRLEAREKHFKIGETRKEAKLMLEKLKKMLGLAADAVEEKVTEAVELLVNKLKTLETLVACKEVLEAIGAKMDAGKDEVLRIVASLKAPADVAQKLSLEVASLRKELTEIKQNDLIALALKEGKTSPDELDKWGRDLALKNSEQFKLIVLSRPPGSVIPIGAIVPGPKDRDAKADEVQMLINKQMGISEETFKKYNKTA